MNYYHFQYLSIIKLIIIAVFNYFTMINTNIAVVHICSGKISPWVLYASKGAQELLNRMNDEQIRIISEYVDPHFWSIRIKRKVEDFVWVESVMKEAQL